MQTLLEKAKTYEKVSLLNTGKETKKLTLQNNISDQTRYPKRYRCEFIEPGVISYEDTGAGKVLVTRAALDRMRKSFIGKPVVNFIHKDLTAEEAFKLSDEDLESLADGVVCAVGTLDNGWDYADVIIWDEATKNNIDLYGFNISCAYTPTEIDSLGGKHNNIEYDEEVIDGLYDHMAIIESPRYEKAKIYENSKKSKGGIMIFKFLEKKQNAKNTEKEEKEVDMKNSVFVNAEGEEIPMEEMEAAYRAKKKNEAEEEDKKKNAVQKINGDDEFEIDGKKVKANDLYNAYKENKTKKNAEPATDEDLDDVVDEQKQKQNALDSVGDDPANFKKVKNALISDAVVKPNIQTRDDRLEKGKQRYSKTVEVKK